jgi:membrane glycosyltransferase
MPLEKTVSAGVTQRRRTALALLVFLVFSPALLLLIRVLKQSSAHVALKLSIGLLFTILFLQLSYGLVISIVGWLILKRGDPCRISQTLNNSQRSPHALPPTAIVMPIYNEDVSRVFASLKIMFRALRNTPGGEVFDLFVLSDSNDPNYWIEEEKSWLALCKECNEFGHIFYRKRRVTLNHKSGNIADFCRRWGASYRYMIVTDADSVMSGELLVKLVQLMEKNPSVGIIQTPPRIVLGQSLFRRLQQFSTWIYGPIFSAGASYWQLGDGNYWGHNAIIRTAPFLKFCALPELTGRSPLKGRILSHDTVEAALMRRAGYEVWLGYDLAGSYEEGPPHIPAYLARDRRWCQGNMQHILVLFWPKLKGASRLHILLGIFAYGSAPLWASLMLLTFWAALAEKRSGSLLNPNRWMAPALFTYTLIALFLPKILSILHLRRSQAMSRPETLRLGQSVLLEVLFSTLFAPVLMYFYTKFVCFSLTGLPVKWNNQNRSEGPLSWREVWTLHWCNSLAGLIATGFVLWLLPSLLPWSSPVLAGLILSMPLSRLTSSVSLGKKARNAGLFVIPEEESTPLELAPLCDDLPKAPSFFDRPAYAQHFGLLQAVLDPYVHSIHVSLLRLREQVTEKKQDYLGELSSRLLRDGPDSLSAEERNVLLWEPDALIALHKQLWFAPPGSIASWWEEALRHYNETLALSVRRSVQPVTPGNPEMTETCPIPSLQNELVHVN